MANHAHDSRTSEMLMINAPVAQSDVGKRVDKAPAQSKVTRKPTNVSLPTSAVRVSVLLLVVTGLLTLLYERALSLGAATGFFCRITIRTALIASLRC